MRLTSYLCHLTAFPREPKFDRSQAAAAAVRTALVQARIDGDDGTEEEGARHQRWR